MTGRIEAAFAAARAENRAALITFVTGGDPSPSATPAILDALVVGGADLIELGMPFTDPMADGDAIQEANIRALGARTTTADLLEIAHGFRQRHRHVPLVLMGYANPMVARGPEWFAREAAASGVDGVICVDIPPEEDDAIGPALRDAGLHLIRLATPTTDDARLPAVLDGASGFLYYVSVAGVTGTQSATNASIEQAVSRIGRSTRLPIAVGFGIRNPEDAAAVARVADGVVVGSAIVNVIGQAAAEGANDIASRVEKLVGSLSQAVRRARQEEAA